MKSLVFIIKVARVALWAALLLAGTAVSAQTAVAPAGEGSAENPYQIAELGHLVWMGEHVSESAGKHYRLVNDIDAAETASWNGGEGFAGIGLPLIVGFDFRGVFDGAGHVIRWLTVGSANNVDRGLFATIGPDGVVENLALIGGRVFSESCAGSIAAINRGVIRNCLSAGVVTGYPSGGIAGWQEDGVIERCVSTGLVVSRFTLCGSLVGNLTGGIITQCCASAYLTGTGRGGLAGVDPSWDVSSVPVCVSGSYWDIETCGTGVSLGGGEGRTSAEMVHAETFVGWDFTNVWGIVEGVSTPYLRMFPPPFTLSVATQGVGRIEIEPRKAAYQPGERVTLTAYSDAPGYVFSHWAGGESNLLTTVTAVEMTAPRALLAVFVPAIDVSTVEELHAMGGANNYRLVQDIDATATTNWNGGAGFTPIGSFSGIFDGNGYVIRGLAINRPGQWGAVISECSGGVVRRLGVEDVSITGGCSAGLVYANEDGTVEECFASGTVRGTEYISGGLVGLNRGRIAMCHATCAVSGYDDVGGLIGLNASGCVIESFAMGNVCGHVEVGGLIGWCTSDGFGWSQILQCFATGNVVSDGESGGLIGRSSGSSIRQCFATGAVSSEGNAGGLIGFGAGQRLSWLNDETDVGESYAAGRIRLKYTFYLEGLLGANGRCIFQPTAYWDMDASYYWDPGSVSSRTTAQMKKRSTYEGWDFTNTWTIVEGVSYPYLCNVCTPLRLHVVSEGPGRVIVTPQKTAYLPGEVVTLMAVPDTATNMFARWVGLVAKEDAAATSVTMDIHKTVTAVFVTPKDVASIEDLQKIGNDSAYPVDGFYRLSQDIDASETINWNSGAGFAPIVSDWPGFSGVIDGQGHIIRGLIINRPGQSNVGLIGLQSQYGSVRNIALDSCSVVGSSSVGGCVGYNGRGNVAHTVVSGFVSGEGEVGGVIGHNEGAVTKCYTSGSVVATNTAGGLVGGQYYCGRICESYATASVSGKPFAGGLIGLVDAYAYGIVTQSYWDVEASGCSVSAGGEGRTTAEMRQQATYAGWDFSTEWGIDEGAWYPFLWQFRLGLPLGLGVTVGTNRPTYAAWAASHTNAWGTADFSGVPAGDFETAWLLDQRPEAGCAEVSGLSVAGFEVGDADLRVTLALTAASGAKQGRVNGWVGVQGRSALSEDWDLVAVQPAGAERIAFVDGLATVTFTRPTGYAFFRPVLRPSCADAAIPLHQVD